jgi:hypothetical protein
MAFINDLRHVANVWLRSGDTASSSNFLSFMENTLGKFENKIVSLIRLDSGFCSDEIMSYPENKSLKYIVAAKLYHPIQRQIAGTENWNVCFAGKDTKNDIYVTSENIYNWRLFSKN